ncbi:MAG: uncharacterized protein KVP18_003395 [Porospora cf. gigantea A]|uniref:uncharacterized protein n=1 Tax=Porospora cf. gigantea A TaxID=2853593 RepID=UPI003559743B|nr:MAG: hypothetical protein KVP18_003395 [Porospora cf. gigantea A]
MADVVALAETLSFESRFLDSFVRNSARQFRNQHFVRLPVVHQAVKEIVCSVTGPLGMHQTDPHYPYFVESLKETINATRALVEQCAEQTIDILAMGHFLNLNAPALACLARLHQVLGLMEQQLPAETDFQTAS